MADLLMLVTRPEPQAAEFVRLLAAHGVPAMPFPLIDIEPAELNTAIEVQCQACIRGDFTWLVFTSANGVRAFVNLLGDTNLAHFPARIKLAAQGQATADAVHELLQREPDFVPARAVSEDFADEFLCMATAGDAILLVTAHGTRGQFEKKCAAAGRSISVLYSHESKPRAFEPHVLEAQVAEKRGMLVFFSPSAVRTFVARADLSSYLVASIGPITSAAVVAAGAVVALEASEHNAEQLALELADFYKKYPDVGF